VAEGAEEVVAEEEAVVVAEPQRRDCQQERARLQARMLPARARGWAPAVAWAAAPSIA
jgi:hypothetical protein